MVRWIKIQSMNVWGSIKYERTNSVSLYLRMCQGKGLVESILIGQIKIWLRSTKVHGPSMPT